MLLQTYQWTLRPYCCCTPSTAYQNGSPLPRGIVSQTWNILTLCLIGAPHTTGLLRKNSMHLLLLLVNVFYLSKFSVPYFVEENYLYKIATTSFFKSCSKTLKQLITLFIELYSLIFEIYLPLNRIIMSLTVQYVFVDDLYSTGTGKVLCCCSSFRYQERIRIQSVDTAFCYSFHIVFSKRAHASP